MYIRINVLERTVKITMNNKITVFTNDYFGTIRTLEIDGEPWFVGKDTTNILGYQNGSRDINRHVDNEDRQKIMLFDGNQNKETIIIIRKRLLSTSLVYIVLFLAVSCHRLKSLSAG